MIGTADVLNVPVQLEDREVKDVRDGYIELLPYRQVFENISHKLLYGMIQVTPIVQEVGTQTELLVPTNCWIQYEYTYPASFLATFTTEKLESLKIFLDHYTDQMCDQVGLWIFKLTILSCNGLVNNICS